LKITVDLSIAPSIVLISTMEQTQIAKTYEYQIKIGNDGKHYAVFKDAYEAECSDHAFHGCALHCFDGYDNAYELTADWWHRSGRTKAGNNI